MRTDNRIFACKDNDMAQHNELGKRGEEIACDFLINNGYTIIDRNWIGERHEIDIVASIANFLIFVEVKTRSSSQWGNPETAISDSKIKRMVAAADHYLRSMDREYDARFDIISIITNKKQTEIVHIEDAFLPPIN